MIDPNLLVLQKCKLPEIDAAKVVDPINLNNIDVLIQTIIHGENPITQETTEQWRRRVEDYACELQREIYGDAA